MRAKEALVKKTRDPQWKLYHVLPETEMLSNSSIGESEFADGDLVMLGPTADACRRRTGFHTHCGPLAATAATSAHAPLLPFAELPFAGYYNPSEC